MIATVRGLILPWLRTRSFRLLDLSQTLPLRSRSPSRLFLRGLLRLMGLRMRAERLPPVELWSLSSLCRVRALRRANMAMLALGLRPLALLRFAALLTLRL